MGGALGLSTGSGMTMDGLGPWNRGLCEKSTEKGGVSGGGAHGVLPGRPAAACPAQGSRFVVPGFPAAVRSRGGGLEGSGAGSTGRGGSEPATREGRLGGWPCSTFRSVMEAFSLCSRAQAMELVLTLRSCSRMAGNRAPTRSRSSRSRTTQWSHTVGRTGESVQGVGLAWGQGGSHGVGTGVLSWAEGDKVGRGQRSAWGGIRRSI